jgi:Na+/H+-dicarboxylate symporters
MKLPKISLTWKIMIGLAVGIFTGWAIREFDMTSPDHHILGIETPTILAFIRSLSTLFLNLIKSVIAPLIFATLVVGISGTGDIKQVGRIGVKALLYFEIVTTLALFVGLAAVNITRPGDGVSLAGVHTGEDKATLAKRAQDYSKEASDAAAKAAELRTQIPTNPTAAPTPISNPHLLRKKRPPQPTRPQKA